MAEQPGGAGPQQRLVATTEEVINRCSRLRVLIIGKSGIGKSTLINRAFGIHDAQENDNRRGNADIDKEIVSPSNNRFVLHDSNGFEAGDKGKYQTVTGFITDRNNRQDVRDKLHAIWLCFEIPLEDHGNRFLETGMKEFLKKKQDILGGVPLVFVFTKYDRLVDHLERKHVQISRYIQWLAKQHIQKYCIGPIAELLGDNNFPYVVVTKRTGYEDRHKQLIRLTSGMIEKKFGFEVAVVTNMAQRMISPPKVETLIQVGKKRYWNALVSSADFNGRSIAECLNVIHMDIVNVWNFSDSGEHLKSEEFRGLMVKMIQDVAFSPPAAEPDPGDGDSTLFLPVLPIALPVVAGAALVQWLRSCYRRVPGVQQRFIAYIVDLTHVMTMLFNLTANDRGKALTRRTIQMAFNAHYCSELQYDVHKKIKDFHGALISGQAVVLQKMVDILRSNESKECLSPQPLPVSELDMDEEWSTPIV